MLTLALSMITFVPHDYESFSEMYRERHPVEEYQQAVDWYNGVDDVEFVRFEYSSDGLAVQAIMGRPKDYKNKKYPVIIYNRGGWGEISKITVTTLQERLYPLVKAGYIVVGTQYRGNDGGQGVDEFGGADSRDVVALFEAVQELEYLDMNNVFMLGYSRGGMMAHQALRQGLKINAYATVGGVSDFFLCEQESEHAKEFIYKVIPGMPDDKEEKYYQRSAALWPEKISAPLLLLHGVSDATVSVQQSIKLSEQFKNLGKPHKLVLYPGGDHSLDTHRHESIREILNWFAQYTVSADK